MTTDFNLQEEYTRRIQNVLTFIEEHLDSPLSLETVAAVAHYSPYHFHRLFKIITHETLNDYIVRKRIEKAASVLMRKKHVPIAELSMIYGFNSPSAFTRAFKNFYGISPSEFRKSSPDPYRKISRVNRKNGQVLVAFEEYICNMNNYLNWINTNATIEVKELPTMHLACLSHTGEQHIAGSFEKLMKWAKPKGLMDWPDFKMLLIYHDSFKITAPEKVRMTVCLLLQEKISTDGEVSTATISKGKHIVGHFELLPTDFEKAWTGMFMWLNENGYKTTDRPSFEIMHNDFRTHPEKKFIIDLCIPMD